MRDSRSGTRLKNSKTDLARRCEILEKLGVRWSTAAAMAKLGRKALRSLDGPLMEDANEITESMEVAVAPCKPLAAHSRGSEAEDSVTKQTGLDVLSSAAEAHANNVNQRRPSRTLIEDSVHEANGTDGRSHDTPGIPDFDIQGGNFHDLDALFGEFVDLSMPTLFQDPLFENENFFEIPDL